MLSWSRCCRLLASRRSTLHAAYSHRYLRCRCVGAAQRAVGEPTAAADKPSGRRRRIHTKEKNTPHVIVKQNPHQAGSSRHGVVTEFAGANQQADASQQQEKEHRTAALITPSADVCSNDIQLTPQTYQEELSAAGLSTAIPCDAHWEPAELSSTAGSSSYEQGSFEHKTSASLQPLSQLVPVPGPSEPHFADTPFTLRPYQQDVVHTVLQEWKDGVNAQMVMLPTGCGKTVVFAALARYLSQHFIAPAETSTGLDKDTDTASDTAAASSGTAHSSHMPFSAAPALAPDISALGASQTATTSTGLLQLRGAAEDSAAPVTPGVSERRTSTSTSSTSSSSDDSSDDSSGSSGGGSISSSNGSSSSSSFASTRYGDILNVSGSAAVDEQQPHDSTATSSRAAPQAASAAPCSDSESDLSCSSCSADDSSSNDEASAVGSQRRVRRGRRAREQEAKAAPAAGVMRVLVLAHRYELLSQAEEKFKLMWGDSDLCVSWVKGGTKDYSGQVVVASVATAVNCLPQLKACNFSLVVVDEAHHSVASTYQAVLQGLGFIEVEEVLRDKASTAAQGGSSGASRTSSTSTAGGSSDIGSNADWAADKAALGSATCSMGSEDGAAGSSGSDEEASVAPVRIIRVLPNPHQLLLGFSATPYRARVAESKELYSMFSTTYARSIRDMITAGYLSQLNSTRFVTETDLSKASVGKNGDFVLSKLSCLVNSRSRNKLVLAAFLDTCTEPLADEEATVAQFAAEQDWHEQLCAARADAVRQALSKKKARADKRLLQALQSLSSSQPAAAADVGSNSTAGSGGVGTGHNTAAGDGQVQGTYNTSKQGFGGSEGSDGSEGSEEEEDPPPSELYPLPAGVSPHELTGGLSMAGRRVVRKKTIAFAVDIAHAEAMNAVFNAAGVRSSAVHSCMPYEMVRTELSRFKQGKLDVLFNVEVLTEGFDEPAIDAILMARPTRSLGLYTQMLGRGLRPMPGKNDCRVLDFTDRDNKAGRVVDVRVLMPEATPPDRDGGPPEEHGPGLISEDAVGGDMEPLDRALDPQDLAWMHLGPHCMTSIFKGGTVWLVAVEGMGPTQRISLGLAPAVGGEAHGMQGTSGSGEPVGAAGGKGKGQAGKERHDDQEERYVVLHQEDNDDPDPLNWRVAYKPTGHAWKGLRKEDAFGAALDYIDAWVRQEQVKAVRAKFPPQRGVNPRKQYYPVLNSFKRDARWRQAPASEAQQRKLRQLQIPVQDDDLTKGEAADLISRYCSALATEQEREQLKDHLEPASLHDLPVPLLKAHVLALLKRPQGRQQHSS